MSVGKRATWRCRVLLIDPQVSVRELLSAKLNAIGNREVIGSTSDGSEGLRLCDQIQPDLAIIEISLPGLCGAEVIRRLQCRKKPIQTLVYTGASHDLQSKAVKANPAGFVLKTDPLPSLLEAIHTVSNGGIYFTASIHKRRTEDGATEIHLLTDREREVLQLVAESCRSKEIATRLKLSVKTVENHRTNIMQKLQLHDTAALTRFAFRAGLIS
jgi:DNA-binding NarL/FixJ family response regulator